jgi:hypothetical protein
MPWRGAIPGIRQVAVTGTLPICYNGEFGAESVH